MRQVYNGKYRFLGLHNFVSLCELKVYVHDDRREAVVIFCEIPSNPGTSVTNAAEILANVVYEKVLGPNINPLHVCWVEHYPEHDTFDLIRFNKITLPSQAHLKTRYSMPEWKRGSRGEIEQLIGVPVEVRHLERVGRQPA